MGRKVVVVEGAPVFRCDACGPIMGVVFDGYGFGERQLEGVQFKAWVEDGGLRVASVDDWDTDPWLQTLGKEYWLGHALRFARDNDVAQCPICGEDVDAQPVTQ